MATNIRSIIAKRNRAIDLQGEISPLVDPATYRLGGTMKSHRNVRRDESGEIASWLILAAGLCAAAVAATSILIPTVKQLAENVGTGTVASTAPLPVVGGGGGGANDAAPGPIDIPLSDRPTAFVGDDVTFRTSGDRTPPRTTTTTTTTSDAEQTTTTTPAEDSDRTPTRTTRPDDSTTRPTERTCFTKPACEAQEREASTENGTRETRPPSETPCFTKPACEAQERARDTNTVGEHPEETRRINMERADPNNLLRQPTVNPQFADRVDRMIADLQAQGFDVLVFETHRTFERSDQLVAEGQFAAPGGSSWHNYGLAVDLVPRGPNGGPSWPDDHPIWDAIGIAADKQGLVWGGGNDRPHVEWHPDFSDEFISARAMKGIYEGEATDQEGLEAVWREVGASPQPSRPEPEFE